MRPTKRSGRASTWWESRGSPYDAVSGFEGKEVIEILKGYGFVIDRQRGSHIFLKHEDGRATVVPVHAGEIIGPGLFSKILRDVELTREDFLKDRKRKKKT